MRDIRDDLRERLGKISAELDELKQRESLLCSAQQNLCVLLEDEERIFGDPADRVGDRISDRVPVLIESTPYAASDPNANGLNGTDLPKPIRVSQRSWAES